MKHCNNFTTTLSSRNENLNRLIPIQSHHVRRVRRKIGFCYCFAPTIFPRSLGTETSVTAWNCANYAMSSVMDIPRRGASASEKDPRVDR